MWVISGRPRYTHGSFRLRALHHAQPKALVLPSPWLHSVPPSKLGYHAAPGTP